MTFDHILHALGADDVAITPAQRTQIREQGYLIVPNVFTAEEVERFRTTCEGLVEQLRLGISAFDGGYRIHDLIGVEALDRAWSHPLLLAVARAWIGQEFKPMSVNFRSPLPGATNQVLHSDGTPTPYCQAIVPLIDMTSENGAPRVVPGTHRQARQPQEEMTDTTAPHPREILLLAPAGSAMFFDGNLWHSGTANRSAAPRPVLHVGFMCRHADSPELEKQRGMISPATYRRLAPALRNFLDFRVDDPAYAQEPTTGHAPRAA